MKRPARATRNGSVAVVTRLTARGPALRLSVTVAVPPPLLVPASRSEARSRPPRYPPATDAASTAVATQASPSGVKFMANGATAASAASPVRRVGAQITNTSAPGAGTLVRVRVTA